MSLESTSRLAELTGMARETVAKRLKEAGMTPEVQGKAKMWETRDALPILYDAVAEAGQYDLTAERARLAHHQANNEQLKECQARGELIPAEQVQSRWAAMVMAMRAKMLALPGRLASKAMTATTIREVEDYAREEIYFALDELASNASSAEYDNGGDVDDMRLTATTDDQRMGAGRAATKP